MIDGLYAVHFKTQYSAGTGVVSVSNGSINGGDTGYAYQGKLKYTSQGVSTTLSVWRFDPQMESVFGPADNFELDVSGPHSDKSFELTGNIKGHPAQKIDISGHYLKALL